MYKDNKILVGKSDEKNLEILLDKANRHGIITGASGSGKTITTKVMAESFSDAGVPVFMADVKGDLASTCKAGEDNENIGKRVNDLKLDDFEFKSYPVRFWDLYGKAGHPIRTTVKEVGSQILSMMLGLSEAQEGVLAIAFKVSEDKDLPLVDLKDLRLLLTYLGDNKDEYTTTYGNITTQSIGVIQRNLLRLEEQGVSNFFGKPNLDINDFKAYNPEDGRGIINILDAQELFQNPDMYASFLLWLLTNLFDKSLEVGDVDKPKLIFFFDEAHLLFNGMPSYRLKRIVQVVKLIRSRGIGLYFVSQSPSDVPDEILAQLGNRVQHTLRAYTPSEQKTVKAAADSFRTNPKFDTYNAIMELGTGEALISFQTEKGEPEIVQKATILPPQSMMGTIDEATRQTVINNSPLVGKYDTVIDDETAYEKLKKEMDEKDAIKQAELDKKEEEKRLKEEEKIKKAEEKEAEKKKREEEKAKKNSLEYKLGKKVANKAADKVINKGLNAVLKNIFKN